MRLMVEYSLNGISLLMATSIMIARIYKNPTREILNFVTDSPIPLCQVGSNKSSVFKLILIPPPAYVLAVASLLGRYWSNFEAYHPPVTTPAKFVSLPTTLLFQSKTLAVNITTTLATREADQDGEIILLHFARIVFVPGWMGLNLLSSICVYRLDLPATRIYLSLLQVPPYPTCTWQRRAGLNSTNSHCIITWRTNWSKTW